MRQLRCFVHLLAATVAACLLLFAASLRMRSEDAADAQPRSFVQNGAGSAQAVLEPGLSAPFRSDGQIFFVESSCAAQVFAWNSAGVAPVLQLDATQACAIESAALANPTKRIILLYTCALDPGSLARSSQLVRSVFAQPNVFVWHQSMASLFKGTPLEALQRSGSMNWSLFPRPHASDVLRMLILWKFGGTYLDLDFIVLRSLDDLAPNFATFEASGVGLTNAALRLSASPGVGRDVAALAVADLAANFSGLSWAWNGPDLVERVLRRVCGTQQLSLLTPERCQGLVVYQPGTFFPFEGFDWKKVYSEQDTPYLMAKIAKGGSHAVHLWTSKRRQSPFGLHVDKDSNQTLALLMRKHCPMSHRLG